ncbi:tRNA (adenine(22)-N(1))-methyltransferase [Desulfofalx alkaliphila]|uniref:tRNA (adenine(22)-N(1))-methyltransferase n=1 Tax=Desulfofalx alkaliphila TaxID=105483 RepID=UPI00055996E3|nr:class I SAM-dependent methyltransferase [Desulfofalx alkaliphila]
MNYPGLSKRLSILAGYVEQGKIIADIGTDHGYLPIALVKSGKCPKAIACDVNKKPLEVAAKNITANGLDSKIELRRGDGLQVVQPGEVQVVIIAGMGGNTMKKILQEAPAVLDSLEGLILQPMADEESLRRWLVTNNWSLVDETLAYEEGRLYTFIVCRQGNERQYSDVELEIGPRLIEKRHPLLPALLDRHIIKYNKILDGLEKSNKPQAKEKAHYIKERIRQIGEVANHVDKEQTNI